MTQLNRKQQKILIVHGWLHSGDRYVRLKEELEKRLPCKVTLYEFPGFGNTPARKRFQLLSYYTKLIEKELARHRYDWAIGHSMGGAVLLRAMVKTPVHTNLILLSPAYGGLARLLPLTLLLPLLPIALVAVKNRSHPFALFIIRCTALLTVNSWHAIDDLIITDVKRADPIVSALSLAELIWDFRRLKNGQWKNSPPLLIVGEFDRVISFKKMKQLQKDLGGCPLVGIRGIGHTAVSESFEQLVKLLVKQVAEP